MAAGLIVSRFLHFAAVLLLFGAAAFPLYAYREAERGAQSEMLFARLGLTLFWLAVLAFVSAVLWLCFTSANMSGSLAGAVDVSIIATVIRETDFGRIWIWRVGLAAAMAVLFFLKRRSDTLALAQIGGAALLLTSISGTGHSGADATSWGTLHVANDSLHLLAASGWLGGLLALGVVLKNNVPDTLHAQVDILNRFSGMGMLAVALLLLSGIVNTLFEGDSVAALFSTLYGWVLAVKIALFLAMAGLAAMNRNRLVPELDKAPQTAGPALVRLQGNILAEQVLGFLVLGAVAYLGTLAPAGN
jgi:copper resistance protein D